ncbi:hypothetical protein DPMN_173349 [Dreissena polymorpha]|uniref:Uncharacterized protein n=1 Tax=Dreissena polymorpha TaxID=45954 RepID=A0A9D4E399_DREPO|nr:hypothetical protein DPMN_173349 [Dreissena polymorpha]
MYRLLNEVSVSISGHITCSLQLLPLPSAKDAVLHCAHEHQNEKVDPGESRQSPGIPSLRRHSPGKYRHQTPTELRQRPGLTGAPPGKYSNVQYLWHEPGVNGKDRQ